MGQPITTAPGNLGQWDENDLATFVRRHVEILLPEIAPSLGSRNVHVPGHIYLQPDSRIRQRGMDAAVVVSAASGPGFQNGFIDNASGAGKVQFFKDPFGWVHLHGATAASAGTVGTTVFQLPPGYRPDVTIVCPVPTDFNSLNWAPININTDGTVVIEAGTRTSAFFTGVKFPTVSNT